MNFLIDSLLSKEQRNIICEKIRIVQKMLKFFKVKIYNLVSNWLMELGRSWCSLHLQNHNSKKDCFYRNFAQTHSHQRFR